MVEQNKECPHCKGNGRVDDGECIYYCEYCIGTGRILAKAKEGIEMNEQEQKTVVELNEKDIAVVVDEEGMLNIYNPSHGNDDDEINDGQVFLIYCALLYHDACEEAMELKSKIFEFGNKINVD